MKRLAMLVSLLWLLALTIPARAAGTPTNPCTGKPFHTVADGTALRSAEARLGGISSNHYVVAFELADNAQARAFTDYTRTHIGNALAIVLDGEVLSAPVIQAELTTGGQITGNFDLPAARELAIELQYGALPVQLSLTSTEKDGRGQRLILAAPAGTTEAQLASAVYIIQRRLLAFDLMHPTVTVTANNQITVAILGDRPDSDAIATRITRIGRLEFVDFSKPDACTQSMPTHGDHILTDWGESVEF
ncbi:MAG TPA: hypothetical protein VMT34_06940 [Aggregatilineales bacterium]|nr:hypothetical protein [Aggregatilineales bacterium]